MITKVSSFVILAILWLSFGAALIFNPGILDNVWQWFRGLPLLLQIIIGLLLLPFVLGLWIWESSWPFWLRLLLVVGLGATTVFLFFPRRG